jgi:hypothetical protein
MYFGDHADVEQGVDVQNEPWSGIWPIVAGESWLCDMATHLKDTIGLGENNIAVITGGISGAQTPNGIQNFPTSAIDCPAVDVIGIHGYYAEEKYATAGTPWANIFLPNNTLTSRVLGNKLLLVEEWSYMKSDRGLAYKKQAVFDQGNALNYRGIPWVRSMLLPAKSPLTECSYTRNSQSATRALLQESILPVSRSLASPLDLWWMFCAVLTRLGQTSTGPSISQHHPQACRTLLTSR